MNKYNHITKEFDDNKKLLNQQISNIIIRQQELQNFIAIVENNVLSLEQIINGKKIPNDKIASFRNALNSAVERLKDLHDSYRGYEDVKYKYYKLMTDMIMGYTKLKEIELRKLDEKVQETDSSIINVLRELSNINISKESNIDLNEQLSSSKYYDL